MMRVWTLGASRPVLSALVIVCAHASPVQAQQLVSVSPSAVGLDSSALAGAAKALSLQPEARALLVARNNKLAFEAFFRGLTRDSAWNVKSISKSIESALVGVAMHDKLLASLDQRFGDILSAQFLPLPRDSRISFSGTLGRSDSLRRLITIRDALTMRTGIAGDDMDPTYINTWIHAHDATRFVLESPMDTAPGGRFRYNSANTTLVNAAVRRLTGMSPTEFAETRLFAPIGGHVRRWNTDVSGLETGGAELWLTSQDMLRFGLLYLNEGRVSDREILPRAWVDSSLSHYVSFASTPGDSVSRMLPGVTGYGLLWWHRQSGGHQMSCAWGYGGQFICLVRPLNLAIVSMSTRSGNRPEYYRLLFEHFDRIVATARR